MGYRLGVDVGGTFTDLLLFDTASGRFWRQKTPSTPHDSSEGVLNGVRAITAEAGVETGAIEFFLHGTTVATNAMLEGKGARVGLIVTEGYRHVLQIARSYVPGGLAAWIGVIWVKPCWVILASTWARRGSDAKSVGESVGEVVIPRLSLRVFCAAYLRDTTGCVQ